MHKIINPPKRSTVVGYVAVRPVVIGGDMGKGEGRRLGESEPGIEALLGVTTQTGEGKL